MKLWKLSQDVNEDYDTYDSAIVAAETEAEARMIHPSSWIEDWDGTASEYGVWSAASDVKVELIGEAVDDIEKGVILASYNAG